MERAHPFSLLKQLNLEYPTDFERLKLMCPWTCSVQDPVYWSGSNWCWSHGIFGDACVTEMTILFALKRGHHIHELVTMRFESVIYLNSALPVRPYSSGIFILHFQVPLEMNPAILWLSLEPSTFMHCGFWSFKIAHLRTNMYFWGPVTISNTLVLMKYSSFPRHARQQSSEWDVRVDLATAWCG